MIAALLRLFVRLAFVGAALELLLRRRGARGEPGTTGAPHAASNVDWVRWGTIGVALTLLLTTGGFLVMASGVVSIKASAGHWAITTALLQFAKRRSIATHTIGVRAPSLDDEKLVLKGAGHYDMGCRPCHGSPELPQPRVVQYMLPPPPYLTETMHHYDAAELFYVIKHGIKLAGMPAWPSQRRDDEVWAMVAFVQRLRGMDPAEYRRLARGPVAEPEDDPPIEDLVHDRALAGVIRESCSRCHGVDGLGRGVGAFPKIAGQRAGYLRATLSAYASGERHSGIMEPIAGNLTGEQLRKIAEHYAALPGAGAAEPDLSRIDEGRRIATEGIPDRDVPACASCHGPGQPKPNPNYPTLAGQYADYLALQLTLFQHDQRGGTPYAHIMHRVARRLTPEQIEAVTWYYASLPWGR